MSKSDQTNIRHGSEYAYRWQNCRCSACRRASADSRARRRAREDPEQLRAKWREEKRRQREARNVA